MLSRNGTNFFLLANQKCVFSKTRNLLKTIKKSVSKSIAELLKDDLLALADITLRIVRMFSVSTNCFQEAKTYTWTHLHNYLLISRKNFIWILNILSRLCFGNNFGYKFDLKKRISPCWYRPSFWKKMFFFCVTYLLSFWYDRGTDICVYLDDGAGRENLNLQLCLILELQEILKPAGFKIYHKKS